MPFCPCPGTADPNTQLMNDLSKGRLLTIDLDPRNDKDRIKVTYYITFIFIFIIFIFVGERREMHHALLRSLYPALRKSSKGVPKYITYNETCGSSAASGTPHVHEPLPLSLSRSSDGIQGAQYHQTTEQIHKP